MNDDELIGFSWSTLFIVTTICSFLFTGAIFLLDGKISIVFLAIGFGSLLLSILNWLINSLRASAKKNVEAGYLYND